ncbi:MAG: DedA family protein [Micromonosporaceae bacterium]
MHGIASSATEYGAWAYLAVFALMVLGFAGMPGVGAAVIAWAAVLASQGKLNIVVVLIVAMLGAEVGGLLGYRIGDHWGRRFAANPGRLRDQLRNAVAKAEAIYAKWGRLAVFFTPTVISGMLRMKYSQFIVWNFVVGAVYVLSIGPAAYGAGKVTSGHHDAGSVGPLVVGVLVATACVAAAVRYYRRRKARRPGRSGQQATSCR